LCHGEIIARFGIGLQPGAIGLIRRQTIESDQTPGDVVRAFVGQEISDKMAATARNDVAPVFRVLFESVALEGVDFISDDARDGHECSPDARLILRFDSSYAERADAEMSGRAGRQDDSEGVPAIDLSRGWCNEIHIQYCGSAGHLHFVYDAIMNVKRHADATVSKIAAAIGEPARAKMLYCLMDGHARTSTELSVVAEVSPSTASVHLHKLKAAHLVRVRVRGKHRFFSLDGPDVASALEGLSVLAGGRRDKFEPSTPSRLRQARTCYDHMAGVLGVALHDRLKAMGWLTNVSNGQGDRSNKGSDEAYDVGPEGSRAFAALGIDLEATRNLRRRFASACLDWSERRPHLGGALGAAMFGLALKKRWIVQELDGRELRVTSHGRRAMRARFGVQI
jgi:DNA-binding transcriptional ArsR family regulator